MSHAKPPKAIEGPSMERLVVYITGTQLERLDRIVQAKKAADADPTVSRASVVRKALNFAIPPMEAELGVSK